MPAICDCINLEKELHEKFKSERIPQTEYFRLDKYQVEQVNIEMTNGADFLNETFTINQNKFQGFHNSMLH